MRSTSALYRYACDEEGCVSHSELVKLFHGIDVALGTDTDATTNADEMTPAPPPPALTDKMLLAYAPNLCFPTHLTLSQSYLGDAGLAAFMRMLPMLRWVRAIEARGVGAGPRTIEALSAALTAYLVEGCEKAAALPAVATMGDSVSGAEQLAGGRLPALELVDLRDNDGIYALSGQRLLTALRKRRLMLRAWCAAHAGVGDVVPALEVLVDLDALPLSTANALHEWNERAANIKYQRMLARETHRWKGQVQVFTVRSAVSEAMKCGDSGIPGTAIAEAAAGQPVGEHVIFRLPSSVDGDSQMPQMTCEVNACMSDFLTASCCLSSAKEAAPQPAHVVSGSSSFACPLPTLDGVRAALQVCIDFGADTLAILPHTNAALWYVASVWQQQKKGQHATTPSSSADTAEDVQLNYWEAKANVAALLRGLQANPALETELETSTQAGGVVIHRHLYRLRQLYVQLDQNDAPHENAICTARVAEAGATPLSEMVALYYRIVAALVTRRFSETHLPSMRACEQHISDVTEHVLSHLVLGKESSEALEARIERLRRHLRSSSDAGNVPSGRPSGASDVSQSMRALPPVMARCMYHLRRHQAEGEAWVKTYAGTAVAAPQPSSSTTAAPIHAFHACHCADELRRHVDECSAPTSSSEGLSSNLLPLPCTSCCYHALQAAQTLLQSPAEGSSGESELCARWAILEPVRRTLPRELRMFFLDMVIRHRSRVRGGCAYVPSLDSVAGVGAPLPVSMVDWLAYTEHQSENWATVLRVFGEWYRLRAVESYGIAEARALLRQPPT
ncbi:conserved hypothetical protein [Leishmania mexicana MHOM/GT/2001/U1103]|uniref:Uncharacterized protein n=1 Tax=Leishmania mexicana (strain MHOM/GT/2001/U1103) TaxID=929439 RepID=E9AX41_LEIMU|nr:conserved hypothetical protein [Leishmania mexicana MHOM/GT/2001/U1103]CBZ27527.1 conserved hypothetical protein [Leishmania mexicana MHOM/GT/2001/U1103]